VQSCNSMQTELTPSLFSLSDRQAVTGRCFGDKDFRGGLENGILLCELLSAIKPGLVKKINRLPTPIAGLDNLSVFLRGCEELGLKGSQLFDPGDLQDTSTRPKTKVADCSRKLTNVLITIYWLGRAANSCISYNGPTLDLKEFEGLLSQMRKEAEDTESPQRSIRDSGYIDSWDSERSDSLSPPRHGREDSFDSLDSLGSRSRQTPSPDVLVARGIGSDGRGSDSESDVGPHGGRKLPDVRKDDMLARRTSVSEPRVMVPFNQYLPNKSNASGYMPTPLRRKRVGGGGRKSWSTATSPIGSNRPFRSVSMIDVRCEEDPSLPHHSQVRHELMHNQYNMMKEEEDHWQDDLARWKSRRRSVSQDLIKKEEERKMMEKLMTGEGGAISQRRKSIKTYREIVEEKERRENELREAYQSARTPEEAALVLHRYALRFTISEAVLERLQLPKLSRSPNSTSPEEDPNGPLKYLRQQSLPAPKFTATVEAQVAGFPQGQSHRPQIQSRTPVPSPSIQAASPKSVPLLTPKPYIQSKGTQMLAGPKPGKVRHKRQANGARVLSVLSLEKYQREQEKLKQEWERAQREVEEEERRYHEEVCVCVCVCVLDEDGRVESVYLQCWGVIHVLLLQYMRVRRNLQASIPKCSIPYHFIWQRGPSVCAAQLSICVNRDHILPCRSVSGKKLCSSCGHPLGKGAAMIIETLSLYFHIQCFKCGVCKGQLGDTTTGTDVRIRNGLLNCHQCYIRSRSAGQPTTL
uniref:LIM and calponin homology domains 1 n=1 Tax=Oncorhynchus kisutch TaxID=8019 RepID=A0A8C7HKI1_ONCKI